MKDGGATLARFYGGFFMILGVAFALGAAVEIYFGDMAAFSTVVFTIGFLAYAVGVEDGGEQ